MIYQSKEAKTALSPCRDTSEVRKTLKSSLREAKK